MNFKDSSLSLGDVRNQTIRDIRNTKNFQRIAANRLRYEVLKPASISEQVGYINYKGNGDVEIEHRRAAPRRFHLRDKNEAERLRKAITEANPQNDFTIEQIRNIENIALLKRDVAIEKALIGKKAKLLGRFTEGVVPKNLSTRWIDLTETSASSIDAFIKPLGWRLGTINGQYVAKNLDTNQLSGNINGLRNTLLSKANPDFFSNAWTIVTGWNRWASTFVNKDFNLDNVDKQAKAAKARLSSARRLANRLKTDPNFNLRLKTADEIRAERATQKLEAIANFRKALQS